MLDGVSQPRPARVKCKFAGVLLFSILSLGFVWPITDYNSNSVLQLLAKIVGVLPRNMVELLSIKMHIS